MTLVGRYIFRTALSAFVASLLALTAVIWVTQALREVDLLTTKGQALIVFFNITSLILPSLVMVVTPVALFIAVLYALNKLNSDSELIVMSASGLSPLRLMRPFAALTLVAMLLVGFMSLYAMPWSFRLSRDLLSKVRADFLTHIVREGQFIKLDQGFVFHYRERGANGSLLGIFMQDKRDATQVSTYIAEAGATAEVDGQNYLLLEKGSIQRQSRGSRDPAMVQFDRYAIDLSQFGAGATDGSPLKPRERSTLELINRDPADAYVQKYEGRFRAELHDRFLNPFFALVFGFVAFAALGQARTTRQGRGWAILAAVAAVIIVRLGGVWASALTQRQPSGVWLAYAIPVLALVLAWFYAFAPQNWRWPSQSRRNAALRGAP